MGHKERRAEGHAMTGTSTVARKRDGGPPSRPALADEQLADQLPGKAQAESVQLSGPDGLLSQVTRAVLQQAPAAAGPGTAQRHHWQDAADRRRAAHPSPR